MKTSHPTRLSATRINALLRTLALLCSALFVLPACADEALPSVPMHAVKVGAHSYYVQGQPGVADSSNMGFMSNAGFVVTSDGVIVIDALATPALAKKLVLEIRKVTKKPIRRVILTHYHADHIYGLQTFKALGAEIWAQRAGTEYLASDVAKERMAQRREALFPWVDEHTQLVSADVWLDKDTSFKLGGITFTLRHVGPAHSPEDLAIMVENDGVLYAGDLAFRGRTPFVGDADSKAWIAGLDKLLVLKPKVMVPGHGASSEHAATDLEFTRDYLTYLRKTMGKAAEEMVPFDEAYAQTDWSLYSGLPAFDEVNRRNAYNTYVLMEREGMQKP